MWFVVKKYKVSRLDAFIELLCNIIPIVWYAEGPRGHWGFEHPSSWISDLGFYMEQIIHGYYIAGELVEE